MKSHKINQFFGRYAAFLLRWRWAAIALFAVILIVSFVGMSKMVQQTSFDDYFIEGDPMLVKTNEFKENFGNDYFIGIFTECDDHFTKENLSLMRELGNELLDSLSYGDKITSLVDLEFMLGSDDGMEIVQIVPDEIPETGSPEMEQIRSLALASPISGEADWTLVIGFVILTALSEILRYFLGYNTKKGIRWSFVPLAYSFFAYTFHWWTDTEGSLAAAVEEMPAGYDELMKPVIDNVPMLVVVLVLTLPISILGMRLAEKVLKKQVSKLSI